jgi:two-component system chemotaxis sensor kinase CheA
MESGLLNLDMGAVDSEEINTIFRAAYSIKGGSGTFGFNAVADFTHLMETLLDEMRDGRREVTQTAVDVLLGSVDCLTEMLTVIQAEDELDEGSVNNHKNSLEIELKGVSVAEAQAEPVITSVATAENHHFAALRFPDFQRMKMLLIN